MAEDVKLQNILDASDYEWYKEAILKIQPDVDREEIDSIDAVKQIYSDKELLGYLTSVGTICTADLTTAKNIAYQLQLKGYLVDLPSEPELDLEIIKDNLVSKIDDIINLAQNGKTHADINFDTVAIQLKTLQDMIVNTDDIPNQDGKYLLTFGDKIMAAEVSIAQAIDKIEGLYKSQVEQEEAALNESQKNNPQEAPPEERRSGRRSSHDYDLGL